MKRAVSNSGCVRRLLASPRPDRREPFRSRASAMARRSYASTVRDQLRHADRVQQAGGHSRRERLAGAGQHRDPDRTAHRSRSCGAL